jgi:ribosomal protein S18 acetylase RimI-like enzyme
MTCDCGMGFAPIQIRPPLFQAFCLAQDPDGLWVAEAGKVIVGFGFSWVCQKFWFLAQLFIKPETQASGVGQALLSKTLQQAHRNGADNRALITLAYNTASTGLYLRNGMYPRELLYRVIAPAAVIEQHLPQTEYSAMPIPPWPQPREWIGSIDEEVLGFRRDAHHRFLLDGFAGSAVQIEHAGRPVGYAYIWAEGHIGPLAVAPDADGRAVVEAALRCALESRPSHVSLIISGRSDLIFGALSKLGFRIDEPFVLMSERQFGDWRSYFPSNPGYM